MKKSIIAVVAILLSFSALSAQEFKPFFVTLQGGPNASMSEGGAAYFSNNKAIDLIDWANGGMTIGYYFNPFLGARIACEYGTNHTVANADTFTEVTFNNVSAFTDVIFSGVPMTSDEIFYWRPFVGVGYAHSMNFSNNIAPTNVFGFRFGINLELMINKSFGIVAEGINEWYQDNFSGFIIGRPLDGRLTANVGVAFHF